VKKIIPPFRSTRVLLILLAVFTLSAQALLAQAKDPHIGYVFPAGGQRGTAFDVTVGGQFLDGTNDVLVSGGNGVQVTVLRINKPLPQKRLNELRDYLDQARKKMQEAYALQNGLPATPPNAGLTPQTNTPPQPNTQPAPPPGAPPVPQSNAPSITQPNVPPAPQPNASPIPQTNAPSNIPPTPRPTTQPNIQLSPAKIASILKESGATDEEIKLYFERMKQRNDPKREQNQQLSETVTLHVEIAPDAPGGPCEIRLLRPGAVSNPLSFCVGQFTEQINQGSGDQTPAESITPMPITLPAVENGQILPGMAERFSFPATKGMHLIIAAQARDLIPYLADAVPGWFQPALTLYDEKGKEVAYEDHFYFNTDPVISYDVPEDGTYHLEVRDLLYRGREDFVYRITIGEVPFVRDIFPLGGQPGATSTVIVTGWNLPGTKLTFTPPDADGVYPIANLSNGYVTWNVLFASDALPQCTAVEPTNTPDHAQHVTLPVVINGRINSPGAVGVFAFSCRAGDKVMAEVEARRLNSPLDSWLRATDANGRQLAFNDDYEDKGAGLLTQNADSHLTFTAPADGLYYVHLGDSQGKGGSEYAYRLRITPPMPDFALYITPSGINGRAGASIPVTVQAVRKDGFSGNISLVLKDPSAGFVLDGGIIQSGQDKVRVTLTFPQNTAGKPLSLALEGHADIAGRDVIHPAKPVDDMIQAFMYHHLVPAKELLAMSNAQPGKPPVKVVSQAPIKLPVGGSAQAVLSRAGGGPVAMPNMRFQLSEPPEGISIGDVSPAAGGSAIAFKADASKVKPGLKGNLIIEAFVDVTPAPVDGKPSEKKSYSIGFLPAIPFEVVDQASMPLKSADASL